MNDSKKSEFSALLDATMPIYRSEATAATKQLWWKLLAPYSLEDVAAAFAEDLRANPGNFPPIPSAIIAIIDQLRPDGRPGADEAWAMIPRDEYTSVVMTE